MAITLLFHSMTQFRDPSDDSVLAGGKVFFYTNRTTTKATTWQDANKAATHTNPVILDSQGYVPYPVWIDGTYTVVVTRSTDSDPPTNALTTDNDISGIGSVNIDAILPAQSGNANSILTTDGTNSSWTLTPAGLTSLGVTTIQSTGNLSLKADGSDGNVYLDTTGSGEVWMRPFTDGTSQPARLVMLESPTNGTNYTVLTAPDSLSSNVTVTMPDTAGTLLCDADAAMGTNNLEGFSTGDLTDDSVYSFTPKNAIGLLMIGARASNHGNASGLFIYRTSSTLFCSIIAQKASSIEVTTGVLTGTTGTDNRLTVSTHTDGKIYIENRMGLTVSLNVILFGQ